MPATLCQVFCLLQCQYCNRLQKQESCANCTKHCTKRRQHIHVIRCESFYIFCTIMLWRLHAAWPSWWIIF